jgi:hypothetical protein
VAPGSLLCSVAKCGATGPRAALGIEPANARGTEDILPIGGRLRPSWPKFLVS